jgi:hypothetical protein
VLHRRLSVSSACTAAAVLPSTVRSHTWFYVGMDLFDFGND